MFAHYLGLREGLLPLGWNVFAVSVGTSAWQKEFVDEGCDSIDEDVNDFEASAKALLKWCLDSDIRIICLCGSSSTHSIPAWNMIRHTPPVIRAVSLTTNNYMFSYKASLVYPDRLSALVATSMRQLKDIRMLKTIDDGRIHLIPHAVHRDFILPERSQERIPGQTLRLGFAARLINSQKNIFAIPKLLRELDRRNVSWSMNIVGDGLDEAELFRRFKRFGVDDRIIRHGRLPRREVATLMAEFDVFLMTSYYEGFGITQIEAMASGAVPVVFRIPGVTDWIVEDGKTGIVIEQGDIKGMANAIARLDTDRSLLNNMSVAARKAVYERFHPEKMAKSYDALFTEALREDFHYETLPWSEFKPVQFPRSRLNRYAHAVIPNCFVDKLCHNRFAQKLQRWFF